MREPIQLKSQPISIHPTSYHFENGVSGCNTFRDVFITFLTCMTRLPKNTT